MTEPVAALATPDRPKRAWRRLRRRRGHFGLWGVALVPVLPPTWAVVAHVPHTLVATQAWLSGRGELPVAEAYSLVAVSIFFVFAAWPLALQPLLLWWTLKTGTSAPARYTGMWPGGYGRRGATFSFERDGERLEAAMPVRSCADVDALPASVTAYYLRTPAFAVLEEASSWRVIDEERASR